jgi:hypothetical protein
LAGIAKRDAGDNGRGSATVAHDEGGQCCPRGVLNQRGHGAALCGLSQIVMAIPIMPAHGKEKRPGGNVPAIVAHTREVRRQIALFANEEPSPP